MSWLWLTLMSAFAMANADAATKRYFSDSNVWETAIVRFALGGVLVLPWAALRVEVPTDAGFWTWMAVLIPLDIAGVHLDIRAIVSAPLSHTLPYLAFAPVFTALTNWWLLGEGVSPRGLLGVLVVSLGAYLLNLDPRDWRDDKLAPLRFIVTERGPRLMLGVAAIFSVTASLGKGALLYMPALDFGLLYSVVLALATALVVSVARGRQAFAIVARRPWPSLLVSISMITMALSHFIAVERVAVAYMISVKRMSLLFGLVYGALLFGERPLGRNLLAAVIMVLGVVLLTASD